MLKRDSLPVVGALLTSVVLWSSMTARTQAQTATARLSELDARAFAEQAATIAAAREKVFDQEFQRLVRTRIPDYESKPIWLSAASKGTVAGLLVYAASTVSAFHQQAWEAARTFAPMTAARWSPDPVIIVKTTQTESPLIDRVMVRRGATIIEPTINELKDTTGYEDQDEPFPTRAGWLAFPRDAFVPEKHVDVTVILVTRRGQNIEIKLRDSTLRTMIEN